MIILFQTINTLSKNEKKKKTKMVWYRDAQKTELKITVY